MKFSFYRCQKLVESDRLLGIKDSTVNSQMVKALKTIKDFMVRNGALLLILFGLP